MIDSADEFIKLRSSQIPEEYLRAAWEQAPIEVWREIVQRYPDMRFWVAQNKTVPIEILEILSADENPKVRHMVASKRKLPEYLQLKLATDSDESVRLKIAHNPKTTKSVLELLSQDKLQNIRELAIERINK